MFYIFLECFRRKLESLENSRELWNVLQDRRKTLVRLVWRIMEYYGDVKNE